MAGNATIELYDGTKMVTFEVWIATINTGSQNEFITQQIRDKMSWIPVRRAQMFLSFTINWPLISVNNKPSNAESGFAGIDPSDGFAKMNKFQDTIRIHQQSIANGSTVSPMTVNYYNNSDTASPLFNKLISTTPLKPLQYSGWIQSVEKQYVRFQNVFTTSYQMNILTTNSSATAASSMTNSVTYAPSAADQNAYGTSWLNINQLAANSNTIAGMPS